VKNAKLRANRQFADIFERILLKNIKNIKNTIEISQKIV
jgi:hypothetical protein